MSEVRMSRRLPIEPEATFHVSGAARHGCRRCGHSCRNYDVMLTEQEARRLSLGWWRDLISDLPEELPLVKRDGVTGQYLLNKRDDGRCVFLDDDNLCIVHREAGLEVKPTACRFFPLHAVQTPDGIHISLNTGCRRLIEMGPNDAPLDSAEAADLLSGVEAITTIQETQPLTPVQTIAYEEFVVWQERLMAILGAPQGDYWPNLQEAARLLLEIPADGPAPDTTWQHLFQALANTISRRHPERKHVAALFERVQCWLPALTAAGAVLAGGLARPVGPTFCAAIARQYLEGQQAALHRTARSGWVALLAAITAGLLGAVTLAASGQNPDHALNSILSDALDVFFVPAGQLALTEPNQQAFLLALAGE